MHDPMHVVHEIHVPILRRYSLYDAEYGSPRWSWGISRRTNEENLGERTYQWWYLRGYHPVIAGYGYKFYILATIWHREPGGRDSGTVCSYKNARKITHIHHWRVQLHFWQKLKRSLFTRCAWCGGRSYKNDPVNISHQWDRDEPKWFWQSPKHLYHQDCSSIKYAHSKCLCGVGPWSHRDYGQCDNCGLFKAWTKDDVEQIFGDDPNLILRDIPVGQRDRRKYMEATQLWKQRHEAERVLERLDKSE